MISNTALSLKPWTRDPKNDATPLQETLARVNVERGHFRDITEAALQAEIAAGTSSQSSSDEEDEDEEEMVGDESKEKKRPTTRQELFATRQELVYRVNEAHQDIMLSLDMISLLESQYARTQAAVTVSEVLKQIAPLGSLGADIWCKTPEDTARDAQDNIMANSVRIKYLQESADGLLAAANRLQDSVRKETQFWNQILAISDRGWNVSRIPGQRQRLLGVHFGFSGSAPEFAKRDLAALITDSEGDIKLERGIGTEPKAVRAVVKKGGRIVGTSRLPALPDLGETTLEARIRHARDSVYDEELFHEMVREARTLTSMGVAMKGPAITFATSNGENALHIDLELVSLNGDTSLLAEESHESDILAQAVLLTARLLLGQAHREKLKQKSQVPPPLTDKKTQQDTLPVLRPLMLLLKHYSRIEQLNSYLANIRKLFAKLQVSCTSTNARVVLPLDGSTTLDAESLVSSLLCPLTAEASIALGRSNIKLLILTSPTIPSGSVYTLISTDGTRHELNDLEDLTAAADDFLALAVGEVMHSYSAGWAFDERQGHLMRDVGADSQQRLTVTVNCENETIGIQLLPMGGKAEWKIDGGDVRSLEDAMGDIIHFE